jgi:hypothetical protein
MFGAWRGTIWAQILLGALPEVPMPVSERARARSVVGQGASASDRFEVRRAMALESLVEAS